MSGPTRTRIRPVAITIAAALTTLALATTADAGPLADPAPWVLPVNALAKAKPGDWTILEGDTVLGGKIVREHEVIVVGPIVKGVAEVHLFEGRPGHETWFLSFPVDLKRGPDTNLLYDVPWIATDLHSQKASCPLGATIIPCTLVTYRTPSHSVTVYMAPRVRGSGILAYEIARDGAPPWAMTTIGYGTAGKVEWGIGPPSADLEAAWDGGAKPVGVREGTEPATADVYEPPPPPPLTIPPRADLGACQVDGPRDQNLVRRYVLRKLMTIEDCYAAALARKPTIGGGQVDASFTIDETSATVEIQVGGPTDPAVSGCVSAALATTKFPLPVNPDDDSRSVVSCIFTFDPGTPAPPPPPKPVKPTKPKLLVRAHPARGGPDLRGARRTQ